MVATLAKSPVTTYAEDVVAGRTVAGRLVRLACERHLRDLGRADIHFDAEAAANAIKFFGFLRLTEGEYAGKPFVLHPAQQFIIGSMYGWKGSDGYRRYRKAYVEMGKGNGKSPMAAGVAVKGLVADDEAGAEIYTAATTRDQAGISFSDCKHMVEGSPELLKMLEVFEHSIVYKAHHSFIRPVSSEARSLDGKRVHMAIIDELHEHSSNLVTEKMQASTKGRRQPLIFEITNSGYDRTSICFQHHDYSVKVLEGVIEDDGWFAYICTLDPCDACRAEGQVSPKDGCPDCDDWRNEAVWLKANPLLDVSVTSRYLREQVHEAIGMPSKENIVKRLNFCVWTEQAVRWLDLGAWDAQPERQDVLGRTCYAGLDLSSTTDLTALVLLFPDKEGAYDLLPFFWMPEDRIAEKVKQDRVPYDLWVRQGHIIATPGNVVDYDYVRAEITGVGTDGKKRADPCLTDQYHIQELVKDRWSSVQIGTQLIGDGLEVVDFGQGFASMTAPSKEWERLLQKKALRHGGHPVLRWMAANVAIQQDAAGNIKPTKDKSTGKIDGIVAGIMGIGRAMVQGPAETELTGDIFWA